jgi:zinc protease
VKIFKDEIDKYKEGISQEDLDFTKNALIKSNARRFESQFSLLNMLQNISAYDLPVDYIADEERIIEGMTLEDTNDLPTSTWMLLKWVIW